MIQGQTLVSIYISYSSPGSRILNVNHMYLDVVFGPKPKMAQQAKDKLEEYYKRPITIHNVDLIGESPKV